MKVAVITLKDSPNYGGILQAYALQKVIENLGNECVLIDYMTTEFRKKFSFLGKPESMSRVYWLYKKVQYPLMIIMMKRMMPFYNHMNLTRHYTNPVELKELEDKYDIFVTGSDQVWACDLNYYDPSYFLDFVKEKHKVAYAASFGRTVDMLTSNEERFIKSYIEGLDYIGVREDSGVDVVKKMSKRKNAVPVLDPTFLLSEGEWEKVASHNHRGKGKKYILCYLMQKFKNDREALKYAKRLSQKKGLPIIKICRGLTSVIWGETSYIPTVEEWLGLFMDAEYIITNSFHGMAFSVNFRKQFISFIDGDPASGRNSRIYDRCKDFGLLDRIEIVGKKHNIVDREINYEQVSEILERLKGESYDFLKHSLKIKNEED